MYIQFSGRKELPQVNVNKCVDYICAGKSSGIFQQSFIQQFINRLALIADGDGTIDPLDQFMWQDHDPSCLKGGIWNCIRPEFNISAGGQESNSDAKTSHGGALRTAAAMNHCLFAPDVNQWAVSKLQWKKKWEAERGRKQTMKIAWLTMGIKAMMKMKLKMYIQYSD